VRVVRELNEGANVGLAGLQLSVKVREVLRRYAEQRSPTGGTEVTEYAVIIERGDQGFGAYVPDLPGCVATGGTREEVERLIRDAIVMHVEDLRRTGEQVPEPRTVASAVDV